MEVNIILSESQSAKSFDVSQMIHQIEFVKVKHLVEKQLTEASLRKQKCITQFLFSEREALAKRLSWNLFWNTTQNMQMSIKCVCLI